MADQEDRIPENSLEFGNYVTRWFLMQGSDTFSQGTLGNVWRHAWVLTMCV